MKDFLEETVFSILLAVFAVWIAYMGGKIVAFFVVELDGRLTHEFWAVVALVIVLTFDRLATEDRND